MAGTGWLSKIFSAGAGDFAERIAGIVDRFKMTDEEKSAFQLEMERLLQQRDAELESTIRAELGAKERIIVAELSQGDNYTKRARPTVVYFGLGFIFFNYSLVPLLTFLSGGTDYRPLVLDLPAEFWYAWGGIVATWSVGRTMERRGSQSNLVNIITGSKPKGPPSLLE